MQKAPQKVYVVDNGFLASNAFQTTENKGRLLENLVFLELPRRKNKVGDNLFYYHSRNDRETDFLLPTPLPKFGKTDRYFYRNYLPNAFQEIGTHFFCAYLCIVNQSQVLFDLLIHFEPLGKGRL